MALPKIDLPVFELTLPSTKQKVKYRPFTVKEEKVLLVAQESGDAEQELIAARQIVGNCVLDADVDKFAMFDLEYFLLTLRSRSVNNNIEFQIKDDETDEMITLNLDIEKVQVKYDPDHTNKVKINDEYYLFLRYPTIEEFLKIVALDPKDPLVNYFIMVGCLDRIESEDEKYNFADYSEEDVEAFMDGMTGDVIKAIQEFFVTMPKLRHEMPYTRKDGKERTFVIEGMRSFFS